MTKFDFLVGTYDIAMISWDFNILHFGKGWYTVVIEFEWSLDCGCFDCNKSSTLTIQIPYDLVESIIQDIKQEKGLVYDAIQRHKEYVGEFLDLRRREDFED